MLRLSFYGTFAFSTFLGDFCAVPASSYPLAWAWVTNCDLLQVISSICINIILNELEAGLVLIHVRKLLGKYHFEDNHVVCYSSDALGRIPRYSCHRRP